MNKLKKVLFGLAMLFGLTLLPMTSQTVFADNGSGLPIGNGQSSGQGTTQNTAGGPCNNKIYTC